jgi:predicted transposase YdaD
MSNTIAEELIREGEARGEARGEAQGEVRGLRRALLKQLCVKFGDLSAEIDSRLQRLSITDLDRLLEQVLDANSLADLGLDGSAA